MAHIKRINRDIINICNNQPDDIFFYWDDNNVTQIYCMIEGPEDTPYMGGFYIFRFNFSMDYPFKPPSAKFLTSGSNNIRLHPNLYTDGKVCLSILGTWDGPRWHPSLNILGIAKTLQSILTENPLQNEPGYDKNYGYGHKNYERTIEYENIRISVVEQLNLVLNFPDHIFNRFADAMKTKFMQNYSTYLKAIEKLRKLDLNNKTIHPPRCFRGHGNTTFDLDKLEKSLEEIKERIEKEFDEKQKDSTEKQQSDESTNINKDDKNEESYDLKPIKEGEGLDNHDGELESEKSNKKLLSSKFERLLASSKKHRKKHRHRRKRKDEATLVEEKC